MPLAHYLPAQAAINSEAKHALTIRLFAWAQDTFAVRSPGVGLGLLHLWAGHGLELLRWLRLLLLLLLGALVPVALRLFPLGLLGLLLLDAVLLFAHLLLRGIALHLFALLALQLDAVLLLLLAFAV